jgi:hypothetical protein
MNLIAAYADWAGVGGLFYHYFRSTQPNQVLLGKLRQSPQAKPWVTKREKRFTLTSTMGAALNRFSIFEYFYRDASNYKVWGSVLLKGEVTHDQVVKIRSCFEAEEFFIAEQLGLPPLYAELWAFSDGPTEDDHVWHTFHTLGLIAEAKINQPAFATVEEFVSKIEAIQEWNKELSPHWDI